MQKYTADIDFVAIHSRIQTVASRLRNLELVEVRRRERIQDSDTSPRSVLSLYRAVNALLDRAEDLNQPKGQLPRKLAALGRFGQRPQAFILRVFNYAFRSHREVNDIQIQILRDLSEAVLKLGLRVVEIERRAEENRKPL